MTIYASMPISASYQGDGVTVNYPVPFMYFENADGTKQIAVIVADVNGENEQALVENTDFTITAAGEPNGTLTLSQPLAANKKISIVYDIPIEQEKDLKEFARLPAEAIEEAFDKVTAILKQHQEIIERCVKVTVSNNQTPQELLDEVYMKLDSATEIAADAISAANEAETAAQAATAAVESAEATLSEVTSYVDTSKSDIATTVADAESSIESTKDSAISTINTAVSTAQALIDDTVTTAQENLSEVIADAVDDVKSQAVAAANEVIADAAETATNTAKSNLNTYVDGTVKPDVLNYANTTVTNSAISNIDSYVDGTVKPDLDEYIEQAKVQSDWEQTDVDALDYIKNKPIIDGVLSTSSTNAVQNKAVTEAINSKLDNTTASTTYATKTELNTKANTNLNNAEPNAAFKDEAVSWGEPDLGAGIGLMENTFTAPTYGILRMYSNVTAAQTSCQWFSNLVTTDEYKPFIYGFLYSAGSCGVVEYRLNKGEILTKGYTEGQFVCIFYPFKGAI